MIFSRVKIFIATFSILLVQMTCNVSRSSAEVLPVFHEQVVLQFFSNSAGNTLILPQNENKALADTETEISQSIWQRIFTIYMEAPLKVKVLLVILAYLVFSLFVLFLVILINRQIKTRRRLRDRNLKQEYQEQLADFLFNDEVETIEIKGINNKINRQLFIDELRFLHSNLYGETASKLRDLYFNMGLHKDSLRKVYSKRWHTKSKGFREVAQMDVKDANDYIAGFTNSKNPIIRVEAQVAMVKLAEEEPLGFLDNLTYEMSEWEMINIYDTLIYHQINIDSFEPWLESSNDSVVVFALRMIMLFKHVQSIPKVRQLLFHEHPVIRLAATKALKPLEPEECIPDLKLLYRDETYRLQEILKEFEENAKKKKRGLIEARSLEDILPRRIRYEIVDSLNPIVSADDIPFIAAVARDPDNSIRLRMLALNILVSLGHEGNSQLDELLKVADTTLDSMIMNVKQNPGT
ncbi:MAG: HEAT repeat domain-containing protein [Bacteroidales bacterium]|nr:HEAT repeat domain-containing protein [Bacteroidales bacterium]